MAHGDIPRNGWVLVCDGSKALILRNDGGAREMHLKLVSTASHPQPPARELGTDRPGRVYQSVGSARSAVEQTDWHKEGENAFLSQIVKSLDALICERAVKSLMLVAPPRLLGELRDRLLPATRAVVTAELGKDLTKLPIDEIARHLSA